MRKCSLLAVMMVIALMLAVPLVQAQETLDETYVSDDGTFTFDYPSTWTQEVDQDGTVTVYNDATSVFVYPPAVVAGWNWDTDDPYKMMEGIAEMWVEEGDEVGRIREIEVNGAPAAAATYINEGYPGYFTIVTLSDGSLAAIDAVGDEGLKEVPDEDTATVQAIIDTVALVGADSSSGPTSMELADNQGEYKDVIKELDNIGVIDSAGGSLLFQEDYAWFEGYGYFYTPLARNSNYSNFVMSGELQYTSSKSTEYEECTLGYHVVWGASTTTAYGDVGVANENYIFYLDRPSEGDAVGNAMTIDEKQLGKRHVFTLIVLDGELTLFVDGQLLFDKAEVEDRAGSWGVGLRGAGSTAKCEAWNIWVYTLP